MNTEWQEYLLSAGAKLSEAGALCFPGDNEMAADNTACAISGEVVLRITGDDAESFLQGQFSNDIAALAVPGSQLNTWSSPKGRVLTLFRIIRDAEGYMIRMPQELVEPIQKRLKMFVMRAKVTIEQLPDFVAFGVSGDQAANVLKSAVQRLPTDLDDTVQSNNITVYRVRGADRFEVIAATDAACALWAQLSDVCQPGGESVWRLQNIDAGVPSIGTATSEAFVLQMLNLQHIDGVSFKKGCFPGQEVVARMQYLGKLKRRMYRAEGQLDNGTLLPEAGAEVFNKDVTSAVGKVVDAQAVGDGSFRLLMVNAIAATEAPLFLDKDATQAVTLLDLPYSVETEE